MAIASSRLCQVLTVNNWEFGMNPSERKEDTKYPRKDRGHRHRRLHRIATVRRQQEISLSTVARRLRTSVGQLRKEEDENTDLPLSRLYQWQNVLQVPLVDLLVESNVPLSAPVFQRARMVRVMKTVLEILKKTEKSPVHNLMKTLAGQLVEIMPELKNVGPWSDVGRGRTLNELGRTVEQVYPDPDEPDRPR